MNVAFFPSSGEKNAGIRISALQEAFRMCYFSCIRLLCFSQYFPLDFLGKIKKNNAPFRRGEKGYDVFLGHHNANAEDAKMSKIFLMHYKRFVNTVIP